MFLVCFRPNVFEVCLAACIVHRVWMRVRVWWVVPLFSLFCPFDGFVIFVTCSCCVFFHPRFYFLMFGGAMYSFRGSRLEVCTLLFCFGLGLLLVGLFSIVTFVGFFGSLECLN